MPSGRVLTPLPIGERRATIALAVLVQIAAVTLATPCSSSPAPAARRRRAAARAPAPGCTRTRARCRWCRTDRSSRRWRPRGPISKSGMAKLVVAPVAGAGLDVGRRAARPVVVRDGPGRRVRRDRLAAHRHAGRDVGDVGVEARRAAVPQGRGQVHRHLERARRHHLVDRGGLPGLDLLAVRGRRLQVVAAERKRVRAGRQAQRVLAARVGGDRRDRGGGASRSRRRWPHRSSRSRCRRACRARPRAVLAIGAAAARGREEAAAKSRTMARFRKLDAI